MSEATETSSLFTAASISPLSSTTLNQPSGSATDRLAPDNKEVALAQAKREVFSEQLVNITNMLQPERVFPYLRSKRILDIDHVQEIRSQVTESRQTLRLIDILTKSVPESFDFFLEALLELGTKGDVYLVSILSQEFQVKCSQLGMGSQDSTDDDPEGLPEPPPPEN